MQIWNGFVSQNQVLPKPHSPQELRPAKESRLDSPGDLEYNEVQSALVDWVKLSGQLSAVARTFSRLPTTVARKRRFSKGICAFDRSRVMLNE